MKKIIKLSKRYHRRLEKLGGTASKVVNYTVPVDLFDAVRISLDIKPDSIHYAEDGRRWACYYDDDIMIMITEVK